MGVELLTLTACPGGLEDAERLRRWMNEASFPDVRPLREALRGERNSGWYDVSSWEEWYWEDEAETGVPSPPEADFAAHGSAWLCGITSIQVFRRVAVIAAHFRPSSLEMADVRRAWGTLVKTWASELGSPYALHVPDSCFPPPGCRMDGEDAGGGPADRAASGGLASGGLASGGLASGGLTSGKIAAGSPPVSLEYLKGAYLRWLGPPAELPSTRARASPTASSATRRSTATWYLDDFAWLP